MSALTCTKCGNSSTWYGAVMTGDGEQSATCGSCGNRETRRGGVTMRNVTGGMTQHVTGRKGGR